MKLKDFAYKHYGSQANCARSVDITPYQLNSMVYKGKEVTQLMDGRWVVLRKNSPIWSTPEN